MTMRNTQDLASRMSCADAVRLLWDYLDGELDAERRARVRAHLAECSHCRDQYTFEGAFLHAVDRLIDEPIDTNALRSRVLKALEERGSRPRR
jgi:anti-sigma factor (TIGR02949 family)